MGAITITDIRNRIRGLQSESVDMSSKAIDSVTKSQPKQILNYMERVISNNKSPNISICMEMFDALSEKGSLSEINKAGNLIVNEVVNKVRDAKQTQTLIKMRLTRTKNKNALIFDLGHSFMKRGFFEVENRKITNQIILKNKSQ